MNDSLKNGIVLCALSGISFLQTFSGQVCLRNGNNCQPVTEGFKKGLLVIALLFLFGGLIFIFKALYEANEEK